MIFAFSLGDNVVNHFASLCSRFSVQFKRSRGGGEYARLCPALKAGLSSCKKSDSALLVILGRTTYLMAIFADGGAFGSCSVVRRRVRQSVAAARVSKSVGGFRRLRR